MHYIITADTDYSISAHDIDKLFNLIYELREAKIDYDHVFKNIEAPPVHKIDPHNL